MAQYMSPTQRYLLAMQRTGDIMLRYAYQKQMIMDYVLSERGIDRIADKVIERIHLTADASEIIEAIEDIQNRLKDLGVE